MLVGLCCPQSPGTVLSGQAAQAKGNPELLYGLTPGGNPGGTNRLDFLDPDNEKFAPFESEFGFPQKSDWSAAGTADFDGDGNKDSWFLTVRPPIIATHEGGPFALQSAPPEIVSVSIQMGRGSSLGRYRSWHEYTDRNWVHGATFATSLFGEIERILVVDPTSPSIAQAFWSNPFGNPQEGVFRDGAFLPVELGAYRIATYRDAPDNTDDIAVLIETANGSRVTKYRSQATTWGGILHSTASVDLPSRADDVFLLDCDADDQSDLVITMADGSVWVVRDTAAPAEYEGSTSPLEARLYLPPLPGRRHLFLGDADQDGRDDFGLVYDLGILMVMATPTGFAPRILEAPSEVTALQAGAVLGDPQSQQMSVVGFPRDGAHLVIYPLENGQTFGAGQVVTASDPTAFVGEGAAGTRIVSADVDGDDDLDVLMQLPNRSHWLTLRNGESDLSPCRVLLTRYGTDEAGFERAGFTVQVPPEAVEAGLTTLEVAAFMKDPASGKWHYWERVMPQVDPTTLTATFLVHSPTNEIEANGLFNTGIKMRGSALRVSRDVLFSIHLKSGTKRFQSLQINPEPPGQGPNKSAIGVQWKVRAAPPKHDMDTDLLPWN